MTTDQKPTPKQIETLYQEFTVTFQRMGAILRYHNSRMNFFKKWNLFLKIVDAVIGIGGLVVVGLYFENAISFSFGVAGIAVFLLFLNVIFDFSKKEETHRWLVSSYMNFEKTNINVNIEDWENFFQEDYERHKKALFDMNETMNNLRKEEFPILQFLSFLCLTLQKQERGEPVPIIFRVKWWQFILADYFSMPNFLMKLVEKSNAEKQQKLEQQQQQQPNKDNEGNEENPS